MMRWKGMVVVCCGLAGGFAACGGKKGGGNPEAGAGSATGPAADVGVAADAAEAAPPAVPGEAELLALLAGLDEWSPRLTDTLAAFQWSSAEVLAKVDAARILPHLEATLSDDRLLATAILVDKGYVPDAALAEKLFARLGKSRPAGDIVADVEGVSEAEAGAIVDLLSLGCEAAVPPALAAIEAATWDGGGAGPWAFELLGWCPLDAATTGRVMAVTTMLIEQVDAQIREIRQGGYATMDQEKQANRAIRLAGRALGALRHGDRATAVPFLVERLGHRWVGDGAFVALALMSGGGEDIPAALGRASGVRADALRALGGDVQAAAKMAKGRPKPEDFSAWRAVAVTTAAPEVVSRVLEELSAVEDVTEAARLAEMAVEAFAQAPELMASAPFHGAAGARSRSVEFADPAVREDVDGLQAKIVEAIAGTAPLDYELFARLPALAVTQVRLDRVDDALATVALAEAMRDGVSNALMNIDFGSMSTRELSRRSEWSLALIGFDFESLLQTLRRFRGAQLVRMTLEERLRARPLVLEPAELEEAVRAAQAAGRKGDAGYAGKIAEWTRRMPRGELPELLAEMRDVGPLRALGSLGLPEAAEGIVPLVPKEGFAREVVYAMAGRDGATDEQLATWLGSTEANVRFHAAWAIGRRRAEGLLDRVQAVLGAEKDLRVQVALRYAIVQLTTPEAPPPPS
ncbi:MAG: hypothetical protein HY905_13325 [Deltaproteobacteria bacterium]|nr:hypothetical protein [Deltaproteobacteria bacterium]